MGYYTQLDCGCYVGFDVYHEPMWGKKCPLHEAAPAMYEALKKLIDFNWRNKGSNGKTCPHPTEFIACYTFNSGDIPEVYRNADKALSKAEEK